MSGLYIAGQTTFALFVLAIVFDRARLLFWVAPSSPTGFGWLSARLRAGDMEACRAFARAEPRTFVARVLFAAEEEGAGEASEVALTCIDLRHEAGERLGLLRGCATLASALGLLGAILAIRRGFGGNAGLIALQAGLAEQLALADALEMMAIGIGTSAICFHALGVFRRAARDVIAQSTQIAHLLAGPSGADGSRPL